MNIFIDYDNINNSTVYINDHKHLFLITILLHTKYLMEFFQKYNINGKYRLFFHYLRESNRNINDISSIGINEDHPDYSSVVSAISIDIPIVFFIYNFANIINIKTYNIILFNNMNTNLKLQEITLISRQNNKNLTIKIFTIIESFSNDIIYIKYIDFNKVLWHKNIDSILQVPRGFLVIKKFCSDISITLSENL